MDTGDGTFKQLENKEIGDAFIDGTLDKSQLFYEGEIIELKGSKFTIDKIKKRTLRLLLMPKNKFKKKD